MTRLSTKLRTRHFLADATRSRNILFSQVINQADTSTSTTSAFVLLHGLLGNGRNLRTFAQKLCSQSHQRGLVLDLPGHGKSKQIETISLHDAARDVQYTLQQINKNSAIVPKELIGHSLGGRLSLQYAYEQLDPVFDRLWLLDTAPGHAEDSVKNVLKIAQSFLNDPNRPVDRKQVTKMLIDTYRLDTATAQWLASSYQSSSREFDFDLATAYSLLSEIEQQDFVDQLESVITHTPVHLVRAGKNQAWYKPPARLADLEAMQGDSFKLHVLPNAGHWVHIDDLTGLLKLMEPQVTP